MSIFKKVNSFFSVEPNIVDITQADYVEEENQTEDLNRYMRYQEGWKTAN